jgi:hypothetical protein
MAESVRVNLSVPGKVDAVLSQMAELTGRSKAALIMEAVGYQLPTWTGRIGRMKQLAAGADNAPVAQTLAALSGQEAWNQEVERRKAFMKRR